MMTQLEANIATDFATLRVTPNDAIDDVVNTYQWMMGAGHSPQTIILVGEPGRSGQLVALLGRLYERSLPLPAFTICPSCVRDLPNVRHMQHSFAGMPPLWLQVCDGEILVSDAERIAETAWLGNRSWRCWQAFYSVTRTADRTICETIQHNPLETHIPLMETA